MLDVRQSPELQAALLAFKLASRELKTTLRTGSRQAINAEWVPALTSRAGTFQTKVLVKGARAKVGNEGFSLTAATSSKALSGGLIPSQQWAGAEFGATPKKQTITTRSRKGKAYTMTRTINRQFAARTKQGRVVFDAASTVGTTAVRLWVRAIVDGYTNAAGGN